LPSNLGKVGHIVVLMMRSRSFDHVLGYLRLKKVLPVDGLHVQDSNRLRARYTPVFPLASARFSSDLGHDSADEEEQLVPESKGFVTNYYRGSLDRNGSHLTPSTVTGYRDESHVWAYDYLARSFAVCDRWFCSVPGPTIPNRLFAVAGSSKGDKKNPHGVKIYSGLRSVFDCLDLGLRDRPREDRWGYYFHDLPMLALLKQHLDELRPGFRLTILRFLTGWTPRIRKVDEFFERAREGRLPAVSWIDPHFADVGVSNDDHAPRGDLYDGQSLVAKVYHAILDGGGDLWGRTLIVFLYDEHGGFFDHVAPAPSGDPRPFDHFGVRVPAIVVSAWTPPAIDTVEHDHTSLLRTILDRFAPGEGLTPRVERATNLEHLLSLPAPRRDVDRIDIPDRPPVAVDEPAAATGPTDMEQLVHAYRHELRRRGVRLG
jgi:phospholipase C